MISLPFWTIRCVVFNHPTISFSTLQNGVTDKYSAALFFIVATVMITFSATYKP
jgi:hypothetical protein